MISTRDWSAMPSLTPSLFIPEKAKVLPWRFNRILQSPALAELSPEVRRGSKKGVGWGALLGAKRGESEKAMG